ncbi:unnamed protein product [Durusdinium trenchii]|uniref:Uncharacterized protein n=1 Tax=Durusdinium trenchii TaxID=1381693 RepID=A0ABP0QNB9_9DINO
MQMLQVDPHSASAAAKADNTGWQSATHLLASLVGADLEATVVNHNILLSSFEKASQWHKPLVILHDMDAIAVQKTVISLASAISASGAAGHWEQALLLSKWLARGGLQPNLISSNAAVSACGKQGQWLQAVRLLDAMSQLSLEEDVISNNAVISSCEKGGLWDLTLARLTRFRSLRIMTSVVTCSALHPKRNESNVEQLLREWDSIKRVTSQNIAPAVLLSEKERMAMESAMDDAELLALKHAEISGWFFDRRTGCRWPAAQVAELCRGNLAEWMAWAFFHCTPAEVPAQRRQELEQLIDEGAQWAGVDFPRGYNPHVQAMRLTMDPIPSEQRPLIYYIVTALAMPVVNTYNLENLGFRRHRSGTLWYWLRRGRGKSSQPPIVFCHGVGVNLLPYVHFITELLRQMPKGKDIFLVSLPHISMRIKEDVPSSTEMVACLRDMLLSWDHTFAHFVGHSFGSIVVAWMCRNAKETVSVATFLDPVCFLLIKPDVCYNFMYREPQTATQLLMHYFVARELYIAHSLSRNFFWYQNLLWPEELQVPCMVMLSGEDSIVPAHSVRRFLTGWIQQRGGDAFRLLWFPSMGHGEMNFGPVGLAACKRIVAEMMSLEAQLRV